MLIGLHGLDTASAGLQQIWDGANTDSYTSEGLQAAGLSPSAANAVDGGLGMLSGAAGVGLYAMKAAEIATLGAAEGLTAAESMNMWEKGSASLSAADWKAIGGDITNPLQRGMAMSSGEFTYTTTFWQAAGRTFVNSLTGFTPRLDATVGIVLFGGNAVRVGLDSSN